MLRYVLGAMFALIASPASTAPPALSPAAKEILLRHWTVDSKIVVALFKRQESLRKDLKAELDEPQPSWTRIRGLLSKLQRNDVETRAESARLESALLEKLSPADRLVYLRSVYNPQESKPPVVVRVGPADRKP